MKYKEIIMLKDFLTWFKSYSAQALMQNERRLILLEGSQCWANEMLSSIPPNGKSWLTYSDSPVILSNVGQKQFRQKLGGESDYLTFVCPEVDGYGTNPFNADAFSALSGTLVAGGILFLVMPTKDKSGGSFFVERLRSLINRYKTHCVIKEKEVFSLQNCQHDQLLLNKHKDSDPLGTFPYACKTEDQFFAVESILKVVSGHRKRPLVITADRGRGKSSALAIACAELLKSALSSAQKNPIEIVISSGHINALSIFFEQLNSSLIEGEQLNKSFTYQKSRVRFLPIDELISLSLKGEVNANLVIIDEAASIPVHLLKKLLQYNHRMVFASTTHGYEGAGRGFAIKFKQVLDDICPNWRAIQMHQPMRWRIDDPLEAFIFDSCLLNAKLAPRKHLQESKEKIFKQISKQALMQNENLLSEMYAILVTAHYQTKPNDIKLLLDNPQLECFCLFEKEGSKETILGVAIIMREGLANSTATSEDNYHYITRNKGRLKNHFLPQSLLIQHHVEQAFEFSYFRIMRIAVHPQCQSKGVGTVMMKQLITYARSKQIDYIGASFGANARLLSFWLENDFQLVGIGFTKDQSSGEHSAMVLQSLTKFSTSLLSQVTERFYHQFEYLLVDEYKYLSVDLVICILKSFPLKLAPELTPSLLKEVADFSNGIRQFSPCVYSLHKWLKNILITGVLNTHKSSSLDQVEHLVGLLIQRIMQKHSVSALCLEHNLTGRKTFESTIKKQLHQIL
jgi:tRNA(Met) cytidine acetyltransferase